MNRQQGVVTVSKKALLHNLKAFQRYVKVPIAPVLKSNAYGHGIIEVARVMNRSDIPFFVVNSIDEAKHIRAAGIAKEIQIIGYVSAEMMAREKILHIAYTLTSMSQVRSCVRGIRKKTCVHIKVDTGMSRQGIPVADIEQVLLLLKKNRHITVIGLCSHLADADGVSTACTQKQIQEWEHVVALVTTQYPRIQWLHLTATAGSYFAKQCTQTVARLGVGLYGFNVSHAHLQLIPALELAAPLCNIKHIQKGARVGYNGIYTAKKAMTIATIPLGYFEGVDRRLSNRGCVSVRGNICPIIGRVSMNITTIDISKVKNPREGERVMVYSSDKKSPHSIEAVAKLCDTITYDICVHLHKDIARNVIS